MSLNRLLSSTPPSQSSLNILHHNIRSSNKNLKNLLQYVNELNLTFSVIGLSETWCTESNVDLTFINGYNHSYQTRSSNNHGGVSIFIKNDVDFLDRKDLNQVNDAIECVFVEIPSNQLTNTKNIIIGVIYRPPSADKLEFLNKLESILDQAKKEDKTCYLLGDFNLDILATTNTAYKELFLNLLFSYSFKPLINRPTRITKHSATCIDNILTNIDSSNPNSNINSILISDISDHFPVFIMSDNTIEPPKPATLPLKRNYSSENINIFRRKVNNQDWSSILSASDCQVAYQDFLCILQTLYDESFPLTRSKPYKERKNWLSPELLESIKIKNKLYQKYLKHPTDANQDNYKTYRNTLNRKLRESEKEHYAGRITQNKNNPKKCWQIIKEITSNSKGMNEISKEFAINDEKISEPDVIANHFNNFFTNVGPHLASQIPPCTSDPISYINQSIRESIVIEPASVTEVLNILKSIKTTAEGWDAISSRALKQSYNALSQPLTHIINLSLMQGTVPYELKKAIVKPIFKKHDKKEFTNYRPISILPLFSKVIEKVVYKRIFDFLTANNVLYDYQFGFRPKYSTNMALIQIVDKIVQSLKKKESVIGVFLDFSKAFDTIDHNILLNKLDKYGIRGIANQWMKSYLSQREQAVQYGTSLSSSLPIKCGVPQGSILGPLLFLIYINDLSNVSNKLFSILFADDTNVFITGRNVTDLAITLNSELQKLVQWLQCNKLSLNISKTHYMIFSKHDSNVNNINITINSQSIQKVNSTQFLGITIDESLSWKQHITNTRQKISKSIGILCKCRKVLNRNTLLQLYHAFVSPYLSYGIELWGTAPQSLLYPLQTSQKRSIRIITGAPPRSPSTPLFLTTELLPIKYLYEHRILEFMYKFNNHMLPNIFSNLFTTNASVHNYNTRQRYNIHQTHPEIAAFSKSIRHTGPILWNTLPQHIKNIHSFGLFKSKTKKFLLNKLSTP